jgi:hypothetical protein
MITLLLSSMYLYSWNQGDYRLKAEYRSTVPVTGGSSRSSRLPITSSSNQWTTRSKLCEPKETFSSVVLLFFTA